MFRPEAIPPPGGRFSGRGTLPSTKDDKKAAKLAGNLQNHVDRLGGARRKKALLVVAMLYTLFLGVNSWYEASGILTSGIDYELSDPPSQRGAMILSKALVR